MLRCLTLNTPAEIEEFAQREAGIGPTADLLRLHAPDAHLAVLDAADRCRARTSLWWNRVPEVEGERLGAVGHYAARDADAAALLLSRACDRLADAGRDRAVGPLDGCTWRNYRFVVERSCEPAFHFEPDHPEVHVDHWRAAGFAPWANYSSALNTDLSCVDPADAPAARRFADSGVTIRSLDPERFDAELDRIHDVVLESFAGNLLFTPVPRDEFLAQYRLVRPLVKPELVLLASCEGRLVGFNFSVPDHLQARAGRTVDTVILKTLAVRPGRRWMGLGRVLMSLGHGVARDSGYRRVIHALMHDAGPSRPLSSHYARPMRRYALFSRKLMRAGVGARHSRNT